MSVLPADGKWEWPPGPVVRFPDIPLLPGIEELAKRNAADAREAWHKAREARFAELIYDDLHILDAAVARLADKSKAEATARKYKAHWARFVKFAAETVLDDGYGMRALPSSPELAAWFLVNELTRGQSYSAIRQICAGISDAHVSNNLPDPTELLVCRAAVRLARQHDGKFPQAASSNDKGSEQAGSNGKSNGKMSDQKESKHEEP